GNERTPRRAVRDGWPLPSAQPANSIRRSRVMFIASYRNTEAGIQRRLDASKPKRLPAHAELAVMRGKIAQLERRIQEIDPKNQERHWADQPPVFKSRFRRIEE